MTVLSALLKQRAITNSSFWGAWQRGDDIPTDMSHAGVRVNRETAMSLSAVWACVSLIADSISTLPLDSFARQGGARVPFRPRPAWLVEPNPEQERPQWIGQQLVSLLLDGTAYVYTPRDSRGDVIESWNAPPWMVTPRRVARGQVEYDVRDEAGRVVTLNQAEMFHIPAMSWPGHLCGMAPLEAARHMLGAGLGAQEFAERYYGQGFSAHGVIQVEGDMDVPQMRELKQDFARMNSGTRKAHLPAVLTNGATYNPIAVSPEQAQFLETRSFGVSEVARFFRVPPYLIQDVEKSTSWGTGIEQQGIGFVTYTLRPWLERLEQAYTRHMMLLGPQSTAFVKFNVDGLVRGDFKSRMEGYAIGRQWGWLSADDVLALEDRPPLPDGLGQEYLVPTTHRPAGQEPPAPTPGDTNV